MSAKKDQGHISSYTRKLRENVKAILENYGEMLKAAKVGLSFTERSKASTNAPFFPLLVGIRRGAAESRGGASGSCRARNRSPSSEHCKRGSPSPNSRSYKALNPQVRAAENLSKLVSDLKEFLILNDFSSVNDSCTQHISELAAAQAKNRAELEALYSQAAALAAGVAGQTVNPAAQPHSQELQQSQTHRTM